MITFTRLIVEGFCSISQADIALNQNQIVWIRGANGEGKSSLISSLVWCIYGKNLKGKSQVNTWEELRPKDYKGTKVCIYFLKDGVPYNIIRCQNIHPKLRMVQREKIGFYL